VTAVNNTCACNTFQHYVIGYLYSNIMWHVGESMSFIRTSHDLCFIIVCPAKTFLWENCDPSELHI
jgi:hypothetical protein